MWSGTACIQRLPATFTRSSLRLPSAFNGSIGLVVVVNLRRALCSPVDIYSWDDENDDEFKNLCCFSISGNKHEALFYCNLNFNRNTSVVHSFLRAQLSWFYRHQILANLCKISISYVCKTLLSIHINKIWMSVCNKK